MKTKNLTETKPSELALVDKKSAVAFLEIPLRVNELLQSAKNLYDREEVCKLILLSLVANESIFLYGPPGTAKSMTAKWAANLFATDKYFSCLLNQYTQPDELFGPVSIKTLEQGVYQRLTYGYMPEAEITFLDEIWKAGPAILNTLLTITNEKIFKNGNETMQVPLKLLISASNEFPKEDSGLAPLYDRFLLRIDVEPISSKKDFVAMLIDSSENISFTPLSYGELESWQEKARAVEVPKNITDFLYSLRLQFEKNELYISDRRWKKSLNLMKSVAFLNGRNFVETSDTCVLVHCLWNKLEERELVENLIVEKLALESSIVSSQNFQQLTLFVAKNEKKLKSPLTNLQNAETQLEKITQIKNEYERNLQNLISLNDESLNETKPENLFSNQKFEKSLQSQKKSLIKNNFDGFTKLLETTIGDLEKKVLAQKDGISSKAYKILTSKKLLTSQDMTLLMNEIKEKILSDYEPAEIEQLFNYRFEELQQKYLDFYSRFLSDAMKTGFSQLIYAALSDIVESQRFTYHRGIRNGSFIQHLENRQR